MNACWDFGKAVVREWPLSSEPHVSNLYSVLMQPVVQEKFCFIPVKISESVSNIKIVMMPDKYYLPIQRIQTHGFGLSNRSSVAIVC